ncbi:MAG: DNA-binding response regulator [Chloroflexi bacterium]|nr:MAG: DNA-binding response regulator [Chloroflexota bacterium]
MDQSAHQQTSGSARRFAVGDAGHRYVGQPQSNKATEPSPLVLVVDDDAALRRMLTLALKNDGYTVITAGNGVEALDIFAAHPVDLVLLDVEMPIMGGHSVCIELRKKSDVPIIFLTARARIDDLVKGLELGGDQYVTKPFVLQELRARMRAVLDRVHQRANDHLAHIITIGDIVLHEEKCEVTVRGEPISLTPSEFRLLSYLMHHPDQLITKEEFQAAVWGYHSSPDVNFMRVTMRRLRMKIEIDPSNPQYLQTVHGAGYRFCRQPPHVD